MRVDKTGLLFAEKASFLHGYVSSNTAVEADTRLALLQEHLIRAGGIFAKFQVLVNAHGVGHALNIEVVGADEGEGPTLLLQFPDKLVDHLQRPLL